MKGLLPILIAAAMLFVILSATDSDAGYDNGLYVDGKSVTENDSRWSWDGETLTLNDGATFDSCHTDSDGNSSPVYDGRSGATLKIVIGGDVTITGIDTGDRKCGIFSSNAMEISGTGTLSINNFNYDCGIFAMNALTIKGGTIDIEDTSPIGYDVAVSTECSNGNFTMAGGILNLKGSKILHCYGDITITDGTIDTDRFIHAEDGTLTYSGGIIKGNVPSADYVFIIAENGFNISGGDSVLVNLIPKDGDNPSSLADADVLKSVNDGAVSVGIGADPVDTSNDDNEKNDMGLYIGTGIVAVIAVVIIGAVVFLRK